MTRLIELLDELVDEHRRAGSPVADCLIPGPPKAEVAARLRDLGFNPPEEVIEFFSWQNGLDAERWRKVRPAPAMVYSPFPLYPAQNMVRLGDVESIYQAARALSVEFYGPGRGAQHDIDVGYWAATWVPLLSDSVSVVADCRGGETAAVWRQVSHEGYRPTERIFDSLANMVANYVEMLRSGILVWLPDSSEFDRRDTDHEIRRR